MKKIILDTNFLVSAVRFNIDIFSEIQRICNLRYEICVIDKTIDELEKIIEKEKLKDRKAAKIALGIIKKGKIKIIKTVSKNKRVKNVDLLILELIKKGSFIVATQDKELKRQIKEKEVPLIVLRQKKYLKMVI
jgi:rRNA-processing protein FCF1